MEDKKAVGKKTIVQLKEQEYWLRCDKDGAIIDGEIKTVDVVIKEIPRTGFAITYLSSIVQMIESIGNKKMQVVKYILAHMDSNNKLSETVREISKGSGCSLQTVNETLKVLADCGIIARKTGTVMLSPKLIHKGNAKRERYLMTKFFEVQNTNIEGGKSDEEIDGGNAEVL